MINAIPYLGLYVKIFWDIMYYGIPVCVGIFVFVWVILSVYGWWNDL